jgi:Benzoate membrane transport protein
VAIVSTNADIAYFCDAKRRLQPGLDSAEQPEPHLVVIARERDHETRPAMAGGVGIARERADPVHGASLVHAAVVAVEQAGVGRKEPQHFGEAAGGEAVVAADARALLEMDGCGEAMRGEHLVRDLKRLLEANWPAQAVPANLKEDLLFVAFGIFAPAVVGLASTLPASFIGVLGGLALLRALQSWMATAFSGALSLGALTAFLVTLSGVSIFHIGAAFWGLIFGVGVSWLLEQAKLQEARIRSGRG